jgi:hypothetical protein
MIVYEFNDCSCDVRRMDDQGSTAAVSQRIKENAYCSISDVSLLLLEASSGLTTSLKESRNYKNLITILVSYKRCFSESSKHKNKITEESARIDFFGPERGENA